MRLTILQAKQTDHQFVFMNNHHKPSKTRCPCAVHDEQISWKDTQIHQSLPFHQEKEGRCRVANQIIELQSLFGCIVGWTWKASCSQVGLRPFSTLTQALTFIGWHRSSPKR